jgi:cytochrome P450
MQTVSSIISFLLALVLYPEVGKRGQEELYHVIGRNQLPTFENRPSLPYINGIVKETLR